MTQFDHTRHTRMQRVSAAPAAPVQFTEGRSHNTPECPVADREAGSPTDRPASHSLVKNFRARNMPVTLLRKGTGDPFTNPGWARLEKHIARHEKAGGWACIQRRHLAEPIEIEGFKCIELADVELFEPLA